MVTEITQEISEKVTYTLLCQEFFLFSTSESNSQSRFPTGSNPALGVLEVCNSENLGQWSGVKMKFNPLSANTKNGQTHSNNLVALSDVIDVILMFLLLTLNMPTNYLNVFD